MVIYIARAGELRCWLAPRGWVGVLGYDVLRDFRAGEEPDFDGLGGPLGGVDAAAVGVEASAKASPVGGGDAAASVLGLFGVFDVAVCCGRCARKAGVLDCAAGVGVQGHAIIWSGVDALDDVDFAALGPGLLAEEPHCGPCAASEGDVEDIGDEEAAVVGFCGLKADASSAEVCAGVEGGVDVNADVDGVVFAGDGADEVLGGGSVEVDVFDETVCRVLVGEEVEFGEEIVAGVVVREGIAGYACLDESCAG